MFILKSLLTIYFKKVMREEVDQSSYIYAAVNCRYVLWLFSGGKVEVRILTYSPEEWPDGEDEGDFTILSDDDSLYFKNMIVSLLVSIAIYSICDTLQRNQL